MGDFLYDLGCQPCCSGSSLCGVGSLCGSLTRTPLPNSMKIVFRDLGLNICDVDCLMWAGNEILLDARFGDGRDYFLKLPFSHIDAGGQAVYRLISQECAFNSWEVAIGCVPMPDDSDHLGFAVGAGMSGPDPIGGVIYGSPARWPVNLNFTDLETFWIDSSPIAGTACSFPGSRCLVTSVYESGGMNEGFDCGFQKGCC